MARFRRMRRRSRGGFARRRGRSRGGMTGGLGSIAISSAVAVGYEKFVSPMIPVANPMLHDAIDFGVGYFAAKKGGVIGNTGKALMYVNAYSIINSLMSGVNLGGSTSASSNTTGYTW